ncbi:MAG TPA: sulfatase-like hydrolase/transferase [Candidatus Sulfotelmatobacter sp.]
MELKRKALPWVMLLAGCATTAAAAPLPADSARPNIVLITLDTTRADRMGFLGSKLGLTPNLDALARQAVVFSHAYAQVPLTTPSHATIFTGTYPQFSHVNYMGDALDKALPYLPDILHRNGYRTAAFVGALVLDPKKLAPGFERGFDVYDAGFHRRRPGEDHYHSLERRGGEVVSRALAWLSKRPAGPFFLWVHLYDPHDPYSPPEPYKTRYQGKPYDGEIAYTDSVAAKLIAGLRTRALFQGALIAVMADHGEAFGEHGENHHGIFLYDETIHVPLMIKLPGRHAARKVETKVGLVDVAPSILRAAHVPVPATMQGESLLSFMTSGQNGSADQRNDSNLQRPVYAESDYGHLSFGWSTLRAWRTEKYLYIDAPERELYDQSADPLAAHNLATEFKAVADTAATLLAEFYRKTKGADAEKTELNMEQNESLHALGYMSSSSGTSRTSDTQSGPDPKQRIAVANLFYEALVDVENERYEEAVPVLEQVVKQEPNTPAAYLQLGRSYMALKDYQKAVTPLRNLVEKKPDDAFAQYEFGCALVKTGHWDEAAPHFEAAVSQMSSSSMMHFYLALVYERTSRSTEALAEFRSALHLDPNHFPANLLLGRMFVMQQKATDALPYLLKAIKLRPDAIDPHRFLADAYTQLGQEANASRELAEAERIRSQGGSRLGTPLDNSGGDLNRQ